MSLLSDCLLRRIKPFVEMLLPDRDYIVDVIDPDAGWDNEKPAWVFRQIWLGRPADSSIRVPNLHRLASQHTEQVAAVDAC